MVLGALWRPTHLPSSFPGVYQILVSDVFGDCVSQKGFR